MLKKIQTHFVLIHPFEKQILTLNPGRFASKDDLLKTVGSSFFDIHGNTITTSDCDIVEVPANVSDMYISESFSHDKKCLCVVCKKK